MLRYYTIHFELAITGVDIERTHRIGKPRDVGKNRDQSLLNSSGIMIEKTFLTRHLT